MMRSSDHVVHDIRVTGAVEYAVIISEDSQRIHLSSGRFVSNPMTRVLIISESSHCTVRDVIIANNGGTSGITEIGLMLYRSFNNVILDVLVANNKDCGIEVDDSANNIIIGATNVNSANVGIRIVGDLDDDLSEHGHNLLQNLATFNQSQGFTINHSANNTVLNLVSSSNGDDDVRLDTTSGNYFGGVLKVGNGDRCRIMGTVTSPGLIDFTCTDTGEQGSSSYTGQASDALFSTDIDVSASFVGPLYIEDSANASDTLGFAAWSDDLDWYNFDRAYRVWGRDHADPFPGNEHEGRCGTDIDCRMWDFNLTLADVGDSGAPLMLNVSDELTATDVYTHTWLADTVEECDETRGGVFDGGVCESTFLSGAVEWMDDHVGNENGLCESNETCLYTPNIGAYQGHGTRTTTLITVGEIENVTLYSYEMNGY